MIVPATTPATRLPSENAPSMRPEYALWPWSSANATVATSSAPNRLPSAIAATVSGTSSPHGIGSRCVVGSRGWAGGSVRRCTARPSVPTVPTVTAATRPAWGAMAVARRVTSAGPVTNTTSSKTLSAANAVCRSLATGSRWAHRARTMVPICGIAAPASAAHTCGHGIAQSSTIET